MVSRARRGATKALRVLTRPVRRAQGRGGKGRGGLVVEPYRGYGSRDEVFLIGRVFRQSPGIPGEDPESLRAQWRDLRRRIARRTIAGAGVTARFGDDAVRVETDRDGYFRVHLHPRTPPPRRVTGTRSTSSSMPIRQSPPRARCSSRTTAAAASWSATSTTR